MATIDPEEPAPPTAAQRAVKAVQAPVADKGHRILLALALAAGLAATAPEPFGAIAAAALVFVAGETRKR